MRKLATIQRVSALRAIEGADMIETVQMAGNNWEVVVKKGDFAVGDLCVYFEIDSFLSASDARYEFLRPRFITWQGKEGMRLKSIRLRKQLSQGLVLPVRDFGEIPVKLLAEGEDVTEILKVEKWEAAQETRELRGGDGQRSREKPWPFFIQKTDQERVQNCPVRLFEAYMARETFEKTVKLDGSSMTVYALSPQSPYYAEAVEVRERRALKNLGWLQKLVRKVKAFFSEPEQGTIYGVCSRNLELDLEGSTAFAQYVREHRVIEKLKAGLLSCDSVAFQGELISPSIQSNYEKVSKPEWYIYDVFSIDTQTYCLPELARAFTANVDLDYVPVLSQEATLEGPELYGDARELTAHLLKDAEGPGMNPGVKREGNVYKSNRTPFSFKAISDSYLLSKKD